MIEPGVGNLVEVVLGDPGLPMVGQTFGRFGLAESLGVGILIDNGCLICSLAKDARCDPGFKDEPAAQVDAAHLVVLVIEGNSALAEATIRTVSDRTWERKR